MGKRSLRTARAVLLSGSLAFAAPLLAEPGAGGSGQEGFRFVPPANAFTLRAGWAIHRAQSDLFDLFERELTIKQGDFDGPMVGLEFSHRLGARVDLLVGVDALRGSVSSEARGFIAVDGLPVLQETSLTMVPATLGLRINLLTPWRRVAEHYWVANPLGVYVAIGAGMTWYRLEQTGAFPDRATGAVFADSFVSDGWTPVLFGALGVRLSLGDKFGFVTEVRLVQADDGLSSDFVGFEPLDLSGGRGIVGLEIRF